MNSNTSFQVEKVRKLKKSLWRLAFAKRSIHEATNACHFIVNNIQSEIDPVYYSLVTSIFVLYARPFGNNNGAGKIADKFIPAPSSDKFNLHGLLLHGRHAFYAHTDAESEYFGNDGKAVGRLLSFTITVKDMQDGTATLNLGTIEPRLSLETIPRIRVLCDELYKALCLEEHMLLKALVATGYRLNCGSNTITLD